MQPKIRWIQRHGMYLVQVSIGGDEFLTLDTDTGWELVHELRRVLMLPPVNWPDNGENTPR